MPMKIVGFIAIKFLKVEAEPELYFTRKAELGVILIDFMEDMVKGVEVGDEDDGPPDGALGQTSGHWGGIGREGFDLNELSGVFEVFVEPVKGDKSDAKRGESTEEDGKGDGVKSHTQKD